MVAGLRSFGFGPLPWCADATGIVGELGVCPLLLGILFFLPLVSRTGFVGHISLFSSLGSPSASRLTGSLLPFFSFFSLACGARLWRRLAGRRGWARCGQVVAPAWSVSTIEVLEVPAVNSLVVPWRAGDLSVVPSCTVVVGCARGNAHEAPGPFSFAA